MFLKWIKNLTTNKKNISKSRGEKFDVRDRLLHGLWSAKELLGIIKIKIYDISSFGNEEEVEQATIKFTAYYNNGKY